MYKATIRPLMGSRLAGTWMVVSSPDFDKDYLEIEVNPYVTIGRGRKTVNGEFQIGLLTGNIDGWFEGESLRFTFEGMDEMDQMHGAGEARPDGDQLILILRIYGGDTFTFHCRRKS